MPPWGAGVQVVPGRTLAEKILSSKVGRAVRAGDIVVAKIDLAVAHDGNRPLVTDVFRELGGQRVFDPARVKLVIDHAPAAHNLTAAEVHREMREFARQHGLQLIEAGTGICHQVIPDMGLVAPGDLVVGTDSHTTTYGAFQVFGTGVGSTDLAVAVITGDIWLRVPHSIRVNLYGVLPPGSYPKDVALELLRRLGANGATYMAVEFAGPGLHSIDIGGRMTLANLAMEMGAKTALFPYDDVLERWVGSRRLERPPTRYTPDLDALYAMEIDVDLSRVEPLVAAPHSPDNVHPVATFEGTPVDLAIIGTCVNGRYEDLRVAAQILAGKRIAPGTRLLVTPASREILVQCIQDGTLAALVEAGATIGIPGCTGCTGASGCLMPADGQRVISAANRNFKGRLGNPRAEIFLASPATVAASALAGRIVDPRRVLHGAFAVT